MNILFSQYVADKMPSGLMILNREGRIIGHNPASDRIFEDSGIWKQSWKPEHYLVEV